MDQPVPSDVDIHDIEGVGFGSFSQVGRIGKSKYAVKVPFDGADEYFEREKLAFERIGLHPNIVRCFGEVCVLSSDVNLQGLLLEYHPRGTLDKSIAATNSTALRSEWERQVVEAVRHLHSRGIIHGDLGCHNILVQSNDSLALADFAGSRIDGSECLQYSPARYARPETAQDASSEPTEMDDIFALGTILYEIGSGQLLWSDLDDGQVRTRFTERQYPDFTDVPSSLKLVIVRCWSGHYASAKEIARHLNTAVDDSGANFGAQRIVALGFFATVVVVALSFRRRGLARSA